MRKLLLLCLLFAVFHHRDRIDRWLHPRPPADANAGVVLYATAWCGYCKATRALLAEQGVPYTEFDIETSDQGRREHEALGGGGVPVIKVRGTVIHGFNREALLQALND